MNYIVIMAVCMIKCRRSLNAEFLYLWLSWFSELCHYHLTFKINFFLFLKC